MVQPEFHFFVGLSNFDRANELQVTFHSVIIGREPEFLFEFCL